MTNFSHIIQSDKPHGTIYKGLQAILTITVEPIREFFEDLGGCWKHKFLKRKANFPVKKNLWPIFSRSIECHKPKGTVSEGAKGILTFTVELIRAFFQDLGACWRHKFLKNGNICSKNYFEACSFFIIECHKPYGTICKGPTGIPTITLEAIWWFLEHLRGCCKHKFLKKKANLPVKKILWPIFSRRIEFDTPLTEQFIMVHKFFWQLLRKL